MTREERLQFCKICPHRTMDWEKGLICKLTGQPADFEGECPNFQKDEKEIETIAEKKREIEESSSLKGFLAFFVYFLLPVGAVSTFIRFVREFDEANYVGSKLFLLFDIVFLLFYLYYVGYTIYAFVKRKPDAVFFAKCVLVLSFVSKLIYLVVAIFADESDIAYPVSTVAISLVWNVAFYIYLCVSEDVKERIPKETRKVSGLNKILFILSIVLPVLLFIGGFIEIYSKAVSANKPENIIEEVCQQRRASLPERVGDDLTATDMTFDGESLVYHFVIDSMRAEDYTADQLELMSLLGKESTWTELQYLKEKDPVYDILEEGGYGLEWRYSGDDGKYLYTVAYSSDELAAQPEAHTTSPQTFSKILSLFNSALPMEYVGGSELKKVFLSNDNQTVHYDILIKGLDRQTLAGMTESYLTDYMKETLPYIYDAPMQLARLNSKNVSFDFTADCSDIWSVSAVFTGDELGVAKE